MLPFQVSITLPIIGKEVFMEISPSAMAIKFTARGVIRKKPKHIEEIQCPIDTRDFHRDYLSSKK
jgi:hypothetical protein